MPEWQKGCLRGQLDGPTTRVGSKCTTTRSIGGREREVTTEITEYDPPRRWADRGIDGPIRAIVVVTVEPHADGTRSRLTIELDFAGHGTGKFWFLWSSGDRPPTRCPRTWNSSGNGSTTPFLRRGLNGLGPGRTPVCRHASGEQATAYMQTPAFGQRRIPCGSLTHPRFARNSWPILLVAQNANTKNSTVGEDPQSVSGSSFVDSGLPGESRHPHVRPGRFREVDGGSHAGTRRV